MSRDRTAAPGGRKWTADEELTWRQTLLDERLGIEKKRLACEKRPEEWKRCYRAWKQPVEAARRFATNWLNELEKNRRRPLQLASA